ncbi:hypothetical protein F5J12DRAFT_842336 [Pisolithus orientalis]|uniref:uncharacterized protein n=1 Tax=Pisolithus orientalis TaxID=936130 RepID=UPI002224BC06|nr:uncharacterized protein F5J12DRAFT_842336 [Pisolithus orientalis]KAI6002294.1 hypothetical protein F5J12DRAFT_842336 [Pisolithus orientalis]
MGSRRATPLLKKCTKLGGGSLYDKRQTQSEVKDISRTLSFGLLEHIRATLLDVSEGIQQTGQVDPITYDMAGVPSSVQEIEALQATLQTTEDEDEQLALEEDITGKILWLHWRGIYSEVSQRLATVASSEVTLDVPTREGAREIAEIIKRTPRVELDDDMAHLQRIMLDARAGISKYESWLAARAAGQTVLSRDNNNYTIDCSANTG